MGSDVLQPGHVYGTRGRAHPMAFQGIQQSSLNWSMIRHSFYLGAFEAPEIAAFPMVPEEIFFLRQAAFFHRPLNRRVVPLPGPILWTWTRDLRPWGNRQHLAFPPSLEQTVTSTVSWTDSNLHRLLSRRCAFTVRPYLLIRSWDFRPFRGNRWPFFHPISKGHGRVYVRARHRRSWTNKP